MIREPNLALTEERNAWEAFKQRQWQIRPCWICGRAGSCEHREREAESVMKFREEQERLPRPDQFDGLLLQREHDAIVEEILSMPSPLPSASRASRARAQGRPVSHA